MKKADDIFDKFPDGHVVETFANDKYVGFVIKWSERGTGFGGVTFAKNRETDDWTVDDEHMGADWVAALLSRVFPAKPNASGGHRP